MDFLWHLFLINLWRSLQSYSTHHQLWIYARLCLFKGCSYLRSPINVVSGLQGYNIIQDLRVIHDPAFSRVFSPQVPIVMVSTFIKCRISACYLMVQHLEQIPGTWRTARSWIVMKILTLSFGNRVKGIVTVPVAQETDALRCNILVVNAPLIPGTLL